MVMNCPCRGDPSGRVRLCRSRCSSCVPCPALCCRFPPFSPVSGWFPVLQGAEGWVHPLPLFLLPFPACPAQQRLCQMRSQRSSSPKAGPCSAASAPAPWDRRGGSRAVPVALPELSHGIHTGECPCNHVPVSSWLCPVCAVSVCPGMCWELCPARGARIAVCDPGAGGSQGCTHRCV